MPPKKTSANKGASTAPNTSLAESSSSQSKTPVSRFTQAQFGILVAFMEDPKNFELFYNHGKLAEKKGASSGDAYEKMTKHFLKALSAQPSLVSNLDVALVTRSMIEKKWKSLFGRYKKMQEAQNQTGGGSNKDAVVTLSEENNEKFIFFERFEIMFNTCPNVKPVV
ncbi:hypothetical protein BGZ58_006797, partial [Dissophora ornata]